MFTQKSTALIVLFTEIARDYVACKPLQCFRSLLVFSIEAATGTAYGVSIPLEAKSDIVIAAMPLPSTKTEPFFFGFGIGNVI